MSADRADLIHAPGLDGSLLRAIVEATDDHIHVKDLDGRYILVNPADAAWFGLAPEEILGRTDAELIGPDAAGTVEATDRAVLESGQPLEYEQEATRDGRTSIWRSTKDVVRDDSGAIVGVFTISHDVTAARRQEGQLRQAAKMEAIGKLAGGIAHDFNNILTAIRGYTDLALASLGEDEPAREDLQQVIASADRATELTRQLLSFSRRQVVAPRVVEPGVVAAAMAPMLRRLIGEHIELRLSTLAGATTRMDPAQLQQVILNLAINARDAMAGGGTLRIETDSVTVDGEYVAGHADARPGSHVRLTVADTGGGIDPAVREHIFEPFFTTKGTGKGTGLGLATVYGIVKQAGGWIYVYSEPGLGTTFHVYLPRVDAPAEAPQPTPPADAVSGTETILLVEDEPTVRAFARRVLDRLGYTVLEAANPHDALAVAGDRSDIDLLLTDVIMPGMNGATLSATLTERIPGLRTLFMSGFPADAILRDGVLDDAVAYLAKPFTTSALARSVRATLDGPTPAGPTISR